MKIRSLVQMLIVQAALNNDTIRKKNVFAILIAFMTFGEHK